MRERIVTIAMVLIFFLHGKVYSDEREDIFKTYISEGFIEIGMTKSDVKKSWGEPKSIKLKRTGEYDEMWVYVPNWKFRNKVFFKDGLLVKAEPEYLVVSKLKGHGRMPSIYKEKEGK